MDNSWLQYPTTSNRMISSYLQGFLNVSGNIILRNQGMNILNGDISLNGKLYLTTNNFMQLQNDEIASYIQSGTTYSSGSSSDIVMTGMGQTPEYMRIKGTTGYVGIKTTTPSCYLHVNGSSFFSVSPIMSGNNIYSGTYNDGKNNTGVGIGSLSKFATNSNTLGINNSSFGSSSSFSLISNSGSNFGNNSTFGVNSGYANTLGYNNSIFGFYAGYNSNNPISTNTTTIQDCVFGSGSGVYSNNYVASNYTNNINVNNNIVFGASSFTSSNSSYDNICFGSVSYTAFGNNLKNNIMFGFSIGKNCLTSDNIVIGSNTTATVTNNAINPNIFNPINYCDPLLWYDAQDITTLRNNAGNQTTVGGYIKTIKNKASNYIGQNDLISMNAIGTTAICSSKTIGGNTYQVVDLSNSTNNNSGFYTSGSPIMANGLSCFCVCMIINQVNSSFFFNKTGIANKNIPNPLDIYGADTRLFGNGFDFFQADLPTGSNNPFDFGKSTILPHINYVEINNTTMKYNEYLNGTLTVNCGFNTITPSYYARGINIIPLDNNTTPLYLFGRSDGSSNSVYLFEFVYFDGVIPTQKRLLIEGYLAWKYKIQQYLPSNHPYYSTQPTALSATSIVGSFANTNLNNNNISIGNETLAINTSGENNIAIGQSSMNKNATGSFNFACGLQSLFFNNSGDLYGSIGNYNNAFGYQSMRFNISGNYNNALGFQSLYNNINGSYNDVVGLQSLNNNTTGNYNCALGYSNLKNAATSFNSVVGHSSFQTPGTGYNICVLGAVSLLNNGNGNNNIAIGSGSLLTAGGGNNIVFGYSSLINTTITVNDNVIFGANSGRGAIGSQNSTVGHRNNFLTTAVGNLSSLFGSSAGHNALNIRNSCGAGYQAMYNSNAINQCVYGYYSGNSLTTSPNNIAMGDNSLYSMTTNPSLTGNNIAIGSSALYFCASGNYNISVGSNSGLNTLINGNNIFIGNNSGLSSRDAWGNSVAIGHGATILQNNQVVLGTPTTTVYVPGNMRVIENTFIRNSLISSDYRIKQDVVELDESYTTKILHPSSYLNMTTRNREFGFIADEIREKYPILTNEMGEEKLKYVNYNGITCISIHDLKLLKKKIEKQKIEITNQKKEIENVLFVLNK